MGDAYASILAACWALWDDGVKPTIATLQKATGSKSTNVLSRALQQFWVDLPARYREMQAVSTIPQDVLAPYLALVELLGARADARLADEWHRAEQYRAAADLDLQRAATDKEAQSALIERERAAYRELAETNAQLHYQIGTLTAQVRDLEQRLEITRQTATDALVVRDQLRENLEQEKQAREADRRHFLMRIAEARDEGAARLTEQQNALRSEHALELQRVNGWLSDSRLAQSRLRGQLDALREQLQKAGQGSNIVRSRKRYGNRN